MAPLESQLLTLIRENRLISKQDTLIVGVSGGPDSVALVILLNKLLPDNPLTGVYVDHNLRPDETVVERRRVEELCQSLGVTFEYRSVDIKSGRITPGSPEERARIMRYEALEAVRTEKSADLIALGHTSDDQVEEILIRLIRGTGLKGLSGMALKSNHLVRPLLKTSKQEILAYLSTNNVDYCVDSSNSSRDFLRNRIRLDLLPLLKRDYNPSINQNILNTSAILSEEERHLASETDRLYQEVVKYQVLPVAPGDNHDLVVSVEALGMQTTAIQRRIIEKACWAAGCRPTFSMIEKILSCASTGKTGSVQHLPDRLRVLKTSVAIIFSHFSEQRQAGENSEHVFGPEMKIMGPGTYPVQSLGTDINILPGMQNSTGSLASLLVDGDAIEFPLTIRASVSGDSFRPLGAPGRKKVSRLLSDKKIPRHLRYRYPVIVSQQQIIGIPDLVISDHVKTSADSRLTYQIFWSEVQAD